MVSGFTNIILPLNAECALLSVLLHSEWWKMRKSAVQNYPASSCSIILTRIKNNTWAALPTLNNTYHLEKKKQLINQSKQRGRILETQGLLTKEIPQNICREKEREGWSLITDQIKAETHRGDTTVDHLQRGFDWPKQQRTTAEEWIKLEMKQPTTLLT